MAASPGHAFINTPQNSEFNDTTIILNMSADFDIEKTLEKLTVAQKIRLLTGDGWWQTVGIEEAGVPSIRMSDGPNGVRGSFFFNGVPSSCFPASTGLGASFDIELAAKVGAALGDESRAKGCHVLLGPTVNTQRSPLGGRGFESFSEDPHLNGTIAASYINGLQAKGVAATIKHFVANDQEHERFSGSSEVGERALREIYLKPFQIAIKASNPWAMMSAYNRVNGLHCSENARLLDDILRKEWGFQGLVMSDWFGVSSTVESIKAGVDIEMPGPAVMRGKAAERALLAGKLFPHDIDVRVRKILGLIKHGKESGIPFNAPEEILDTPEVRATMRTAAADSVVVLKNDKKLLPLSPNTGKKIAFIGPNAKYANFSGGGSARLRASYTVAPLEAIAQAGKDLGLEVQYAVGVSCHQYLPLLDPFIKDAKLEFWNEPPSKDFLSQDPQEQLTAPLWETDVTSSYCWLMDNVDPKVHQHCDYRFTAKFVPDEDGDWELGLTIISRGNLFFENKLVVDLVTNPQKGDSFFSQGTTEDRGILKGLKAGQEYHIEARVRNPSADEMPPFPSWGGVRVGGVVKGDVEEGIAKAASLARESDAAILVVGLNHEYESEGFDRPDMELPGDTNKLVQEVLAANPNTIVVNQSGTPVAMPWVQDAHTLVQAFYGGNELGNGLADVLFGKVNPSGKLPITFPKRLEDSPAFPSYSTRSEVPDKVYYSEGIFVGYRGFEVKKIDPLFAFGHGLSYSQFEYSNLEISKISAEGNFSLTFDIKNTSEVKGREVAQIYISDDQATLPRPQKELKGFIKVELAPGELKTIKHTLDREALSFYDERASHWVAEKGDFTVRIGASSVDLRLEGKAELVETFTWTGL